MTGPIEDVSTLPGKKVSDHGIDRADEELRGDNDSYATLVTEDTDGMAQRAEDPDSLETPNANKISEETKERLHNPGDKRTRDVDAGAIADENAAHETGEGEGDPEDDPEPSEMQVHGHDD